MIGRRIATLLNDESGKPGRLMVSLREDAPEPTIALIDHPPPSVGTRSQQIAVPIATLDVVVPHVEQRLGLSRPPRENTLTDRFIACLSVLAGRGTPRELSETSGLYCRTIVDLVADWCTEVGAAHETTTRWSRTGPSTRTRRTVLLRVRPTEPGRCNRTLSLDISHDEDHGEGHGARVEFNESYKQPGTADSALQHTVAMTVPAMESLARVVWARLGKPDHDLVDVPERALVQAFVALVEHGALGDHLPYPGNRDLIYDMSIEAGLDSRRSGPNHTHDFHGSPLSTADGRVSMGVRSNTRDNRPIIEFSHYLWPARRPDDSSVESIHTTVRAPLSALDALVTSFGLGPDASPAPTPSTFQNSVFRPGRGATRSHFEKDSPATEHDLARSLAALLSRRDLGPAPHEGVSARDTAAHVAGLFAAAGVPYEVCEAHTRPVLKTFRQATGCYYTLRVSIKTLIRSRGTDPPTAALAAVDFVENYDYVGRPGDSGREYSYTTTLSETPMKRLVEAFERWLDGDADPPDNRHREVVDLPTPTIESSFVESRELTGRLFTGFSRLAARDELSDDLGIGANRDRVAEILRTLDLPDTTVTTEESHWINSD